MHTVRTVAVMVLTACGAAVATPSASVDRPASGTAVAVEALTSRSAASAAVAVPADFEALVGYSPRMRNGLLVNPHGTCSSPLPLPQDFTLACAEHDLGYDLLRYADLTGNALGAWARTAVDDRLVRRLRAVCAAQDPGLQRAACGAAAHMAATAVEVNSVRQFRGVPEETPASWAVTVTAVAAVVAACSFHVRRRRSRHGVRPPVLHGVPT